MKIWITRNDDVSAWIGVWVGKKPVKLSTGTWFSGSGGLDEFLCRPTVRLDPKKFKRAYGFTPRKGSCKQYQLTLKEIK